MKDLRSRCEQSPKAATYHGTGVMQLKKVRYGNASHWGGRCARYIEHEDLRVHLPNKRDSRGRFPLKVVLTIHPQKAKRRGLEKKAWALVEIYAINAAQSTAFARLVKYLPDGNPWVLGEGYTYPWLDESLH